MQWKGERRRVLIWPRLTLPKISTVQKVNNKYIQTVRFVKGISLNASSTHIAMARTVLAYKKFLTALFPFLRTTLLPVSSHAVMRTNPAQISGMTFLMIASSKRRIRRRRRTNLGERVVSRLKKCRERGNGMSFGEWGLRHYVRGRTYGYV